MQKPEFDVHPDMHELLAAKKALPQTQEQDGQRAGWAAYAASMQRDYPAGMSVRDTSFVCPGAGRDGTIAVRIYRPADAPACSPCVVYLHGGAFIKGSLDSGDPIAWGVADHVGCVVIGIDYRLAPEHPFPAGVEDCYAVVRHVAENGAAYGIDPSRLAVWGDSAGGNMAAAVCLMARDRGGPAILAQALNYACLTDDLSAEAYRHYAEAPVTTASIDRAWSLYLGDRRPTSDPYAAPLKAQDLANLPPAHVHLAEIDCLADDSRQYAWRLTAAGNRAVLRTAPRMIHGYLRARFSGPVAAEEFAAPCQFLRDILFQGLPPGNARSEGAA
ncbi:alpha/beta hydrolase [Limobrevibacterium gyesilva]|uniref:Alpha/beta hydrolase n=1 Tax=Limobrevibacterium gyesilva TaxID=2991712 RepID=A0AA41YJD2_9PROT|nr:alpha/beta hydrolase [Limobrevibacterium gyesilva]MCW3474741.1 alpha/beta hydrolase [Limobrevibacterium gyesilva]